MLGIREAKVRDLAARAGGVSGRGRGRAAGPLIWGLWGMNSALGADAPLSAAQRKLVEDNIGLVRLHLRRNVHNIHRGRSGREYDDLFQEGCTGLIKAARGYDPDCGIAFAAYALARIHTAVSEALLRDASVIHVPLKRQRRRWREPVSDPRDPPAVCWPRVQPLDNDPPDRRIRHRPDRDPNQPTVGERLRQKVQVAVDSAERRVSIRKDPRGDRGELAGKVARERLLVAEHHGRSRLRQIAAETGSSFSRVIHCERRLSEEVRRALTGDLEFRRLMEMLGQPDGVDAGLDYDEEAQLRALAAESFARRLTQSDEPTRLRLLDRLLMGDQALAERIVRETFANLPRETTDEVFRETAEWI